MIRAELEKMEQKVVALAPTNVAARLIDGKTIHKYIAEISSKLTTELATINDLFFDETSMVHEMFYKFFSLVKRKYPHIKFIIAGDFEQLLPVKDRVEKCDYKNSGILHELCDGRRIQLTKCRRADDTLFKKL